MVREGVQLAKLFQLYISIGKNFHLAQFSGVCKRLFFIFDSLLLRFQK